MFKVAFPNLSSPREAYSRSQKVGNPIASILKSNVWGIPALFGLNPVSNFMGFTVNTPRPLSDLLEPWALNPHTLNLNWNPEPETLNPKPPKTQAILAQGSRLERLASEGGPPFRLHYLGEQ